MNENMARKVAELIHAEAQSGNASWDELNGPDAAVMTRPDQATQVIFLPAEYDGDGPRKDGAICVITVEVRPSPFERRLEAGLEAGSVMRAAELVANRMARFLPMTAAAETRPCVEVGGIQVYAYLDDGVLRVSVHYDGVEQAFVTGPGGTVPTEFRAGGAVAWKSP
jgi:hypothetical protein